ncbi:hypothetical protein [Aulosira sp. FACHB-615]|uniref:hypothetical protein n=1 Tax=Aulosira sp. FACHB-615 TaxID=2692777 RepID=UPI0016843AF1|nr:hypothetical protein [Aulosira sp. FACHB-615]MBD2492609.1 hypothetical protein [Aulosira sp. FACHB-615]
MNFTMPKRDRPHKHKQDPWLSTLYWALVVAGLWFAYLNIQPYEKIVGLLSGKTLNSAFLQIISIIPIINGIAAIIGKGVTWILGTILWACIQIIEVLPLVLYNNESFVRAAIASADSRSRYQIKDEDDPTLKMLKRVYNSLPTSVISNLEQLKIFTYTIDFLICITVYSPVQSGKFADFFFVLATGQWGKLDWLNLLLAGVTLFAIEVIVSLIIWVGKLSNAVQETKR